MTAALVTTIEELTPSLGTRSRPPTHVRGLGRLVPVTIRHLIGDDVAELIDVPPSRPGWWRLVAPLLRLVRLDESDLERDALLKRTIEPLARVVIRGMFDHERGGRARRSPSPTSWREVGPVVVTVTSCGRPDR